ncbi:MAG: DUF1549 domain-containing protein, partial [Pirellulaceae bacterium]|nr:DUF1549 domain-containing protein [Pirellulaceae bacterium]
MKLVSRRVRLPVEHRQLGAAALPLFAALFLFLLPAGAVDASDFVIESLRIENSDSVACTTLVGRDARLQLLVTAELPDGEQRDWTRHVTYHASPSGLIKIDPGGLVTPVANGTVSVRVTDAAGTTAEATLVVSHIGNDVPVSFPSQIVPVFTKFGCNSGGCHGKSAGQNGFRLSLLGFVPHEDYEHLVKESRGRRLSPAAPDQSLLLLKATNVAPHGGGERLKQDSHEYRVLRRWITQAMPYGDSSAATVVSIEVFPAQRRLAKDQSQQLAVIANYSDGSVEDVTRAALYESNAPEMAEVDSTGLVSLGNSVGDVSVMARYQGHVTVFRADVPLGATDNWEPRDWPIPVNVVDEHVFAKLRSLGIPPSAQCDDATYLRRVTLDIAGRLPTLAETAAMQADVSADKRAKLVDRLLESEDYSEYFARKWNTILRNKRSGNSLDFRTAVFHRWIRDSLHENKPYDRFVREIVTASGSVASNPPVAWLNQVADTNQRIEDTAQ